MRRIERALISVYDKTGVVEFARALADLGAEIVSSGGTFRLLLEHGIPAREVSDLTGFPEILDGRVKTINPRIAGGVLAIRDNASHMAEIAKHSLPLIDLVCVNLYPFSETIRRREARFEDAIENIDIGGPSLIRAAAKNFQDVAVVTSPDQYAAVAQALKLGGGVLDRGALFDLARKAFLCTARYDGQIAEYLGNAGLAADFPPNIFMDFEKAADVRYGENPHQRAAVYRWGGHSGFGLAAAKQLQGKDLSYNNLVDLEAAWNLICEFDDPACCVVKHTNPCGAAIGSTLCEAYLKAYEADPVSAFGSIIAVNRVVDGDTAVEMAKLFVEALIARGFSDDALATFSTKKNLRLMQTGPEPPDIRTRWSDYDLKRISGGLLVQELDAPGVAHQSRVVSKRSPSAAEERDLKFAWNVVKHVKSNAIVIGRDGRTTGVGAGQMSRIDAVRLSVAKAASAAAGSVLASDAFFPFRDNIDEAARAGITAVIQPGGSVRDAEVIDAADEHGIAMIFTGVRHFKH